MNSIYRLSGGGCRVCRAEPQFWWSAAGYIPGAAASSQARIPTLHCEFKAMSACAPWVPCKEAPRFPHRSPSMNSVAPRRSMSQASRAPTNSHGVADTWHQLAMHGIDGPFGWQLRSTSRV